MDDSPRPCVLNTYKILGKKNNYGHEILILEDIDKNKYQAFDQKLLSHSRHVMDHDTLFINPIKIIVIQNLELSVWAFPEFNTLRLQTKCLELELYDLNTKKEMISTFLDKLRILILENKKYPDPRKFNSFFQKQLIHSQVQDKKPIIKIFFPYELSQVFDNDQSGLDLFWSLTLDFLIKLIINNLWNKKELKEYSDLLEKYNDLIPDSTRKHLFFDLELRLGSSNDPEYKELSCFCFWDKKLIQERSLAFNNNTYHCTQNNNSKHKTLVHLKDLKNYDLDILCRVHDFDLIELWTKICNTEYKNKKFFCNIKLDNLETTPVLLGPRINKFSMERCMVNGLRSNVLRLIRQVMFIHELNYYFKSNVINWSEALGFTNKNHLVLRPLMSIQYKDPNHYAKYMIQDYLNLSKLLQELDQEHNFIDPTFFFRISKIYDMKRRMIPCQKEFNILFLMVYLDSRKEK